MPTSRVAFAVLCILGIIAISVGATLEIGRFRRGDSLVPLRQFRLRLVSATTWIVCLATFFYAVIWIWPDSIPPGVAPSVLAKSQANTFALVLLGAIGLLLIGLFLLIIDVWQTSVTRRMHEARARANRVELAREEV